MFKTPSPVGTCALAVRCSAHSRIAGDSSPPQHDWMPNALQGSSSRSQERDAQHTMNEPLPPHGPHRMTLTFCETPIDGAREHWASTPATGPRCARGWPPFSSHASVARTATRSSTQGPASALRFNYCKYARVARWGRNCLTAFHIKMSVSRPTNPA